MKVHLFRSDDLDGVVFQSLIDRSNAPLRHIEIVNGRLDPEDVSAIIADTLEEPARLWLTWEGVEQVIEIIRERTGIPEQEEVVLLTPTINDVNFFVFLLGGNNTYIHTADWKRFTHADMDVAVAYILARNILTRGMHDFAEERLNALHRKPRGCIMDFCLDKSDVQLMMRTADACPECMKRIGERIKSGHLNIEVVKDCFRLMERTRADLLYVRQFPWTEEPARIRIEGMLQHIDLVGQGKRFKLPPMQRALYLTFLECLNGIPLSHLPDPEHLSRLTAFYSAFAPSGTRQSQAEVARELAEDVDGKLRQTLSKIRRVFRDELGEEEANHYTIEGDAEGIFRIALDRRYVTWTDRHDRPMGYLDCTDPN